MTLRREGFPVRERDEYETAEEAVRAARAILALLGTHLLGEVCSSLAVRLPEDFALVLLNPPQTPNRCLRSGSSTRPTSVADVRTVERGRASTSSSIRPASSFRRPRTAGCCNRDPSTRSNEGWIRGSRPWSRPATRWLSRSHRCSPVPSSRRRAALVARKELLHPSVASSNERDS
ncbi:hypothetical protein [Streptomyces sp. NPDC059176]|uniref:hypothetical protein n=1 Tax=unclassified Streptomyces TaxID=2593676 RepID=UPI003676123A